MNKVKVVVVGSTGGTTAECDTVECDKSIRGVHEFVVISKGRLLQCCRCGFKINRGRFSQEYCVCAFESPHTRPDLFQLVSTGNTALKYVCLVCNKPHFSRFTSNF